MSLEYFWDIIIHLLETVSTRIYTLFEVPKSKYLT